MKVLVTANFTEEGLERLEQDFGMEVVYDPWGAKNRIIMSEDLAEKLVELKADAVILEVDLCHDEVFEAIKLKFVGCCRGEPLNVDVEEATDAGTPVFYTPGRNAHAVADLTVGFMLCHHRKIIAAHNLLFSGEFDPDSPAEFMEMYKSFSGRELGCLSLGIVGLGAVGTEVARRVKGFGSPMMAYDPFAPDERFDELGVTRVELAELFAQADMVTIHAADLDETQGMITRELIESMKPTALFLNLARAHLVDNDALYDALKDKNIAGAGLDVFESEPPTKDDRFLALDNVIAMPHLGGSTKDVVKRQTDILLDDLDAFLNGRKPKFCANPEVLE